MLVLDWWVFSSHASSGHGGRSAGSEQEGRGAVAEVGMGICAVEEMGLRRLDPSIRP